MIIWWLIELLSTKFGFDYFSGVITSILDEKMLICSIQIDSKTAAQ